MNSVANAMPSMMIISMSCLTGWWSSNNGWSMPFGIWKTSKQITAHKANQTASTAMTAATAAASQTPPSARHIYQDYDDGINFPNDLFDASPTTKKSIPSPTVMSSLELQHLLRPQARAGPRAPQQGRILGPPAISSIFSHAEDGMLSYEGVILGKRSGSFSILFHTSYLK